RARDRARQRSGGRRRPRRRWGGTGSRARGRGVARRPPTRGPDRGHSRATGAAGRPYYGGAMAQIGFDEVTKVYEDGTEAVRSVDLTIEDGTLMVLVGPSGCGKTTLLRMVAGLEEITGGSIRLGDAVINDVEAKNRDLAMVFQNYALYPHMT